MEGEVCVTGNPFKQNQQHQHLEIPMVIQQLQVSNWQNIPEVLSLSATTGLDLQQSWRIIIKSRFSKPDQSMFLYITAAMIILRSTITPVPSIVQFHLHNINNPDSNYIPDGKNQRKVLLILQKVAIIFTIL